MKHVLRLLVLLVGFPFIAVAQTVLVNLGNVPSAPAGAANITFQHDGSTPPNASGYFTEALMDALIQGLNGCSTSATWPLPWSPQDNVCHAPGSGNVNTGSVNTYGAFSTGLLRRLNQGSSRFSLRRLQVPGPRWASSPAPRAAGRVFRERGFRPEAYTLPGAVVQTGQTNAYGAFLQDFSAASIKVPAGFLSGDCTWTAVGVITCAHTTGNADTSTKLSVTGGNGTFWGVQGGV